jgi:hypothetical protein
MLRKQSILSCSLCLIGVLLALPALVAAAPLAPVQAGGQVNDAVVSGDLAYLASGPSVSVWQLSSDGTAPPAQVGATSPLRGQVRGLAVIGDYLFATWATGYPYGQLAVFSLTDPVNPEHILDFEYSSGTILRPGGLVAIGDVLLMIDSESGLYSIDVSDPLAPSVTTTIPSAGLQRLAITGNHVLGWGPSFIGGFVVDVYDVTVPSVPSWAGFYSSWGNYVNAAVSGDTMILVGDGFEVVSLANPAMPAMLTTIPNWGTYIQSAIMDGDLAYLGDDAGVHVWDLSTPATPVAGDLVAAPADRTDTAAFHPISGGLEMILFTGMGRGLALDLDTPASPTLEHVFDLPVGSDTYDVATLASGDLAVSDFYSGLRISDAGLNSVGRFDPAIAQGGYEHLAIDGTTAYMASWGYGLLILDVSDPGAPSLLNSVFIQYASSVDVNGDMAYVVTSTNGGILQIVDVSNPQLPIPRGSLSISKGLDVIHHGSMVLIADEDYAGSGLKIIDVSIPDSPIQLGTYSDCSTASGVAADGDLAFLACSNGSMHVVSIADPAMPTQVGVYTDPSTFMQGSSIGYHDGVVWYGHTSGVDVIDVSDPAQPTRILRFDTAGAVRGMEVGEDGNAWLAATTDGLYRVQPFVFRDGFESGDTGAWTTQMQ